MSVEESPRSGVQETARQEIVLGTRGSELALAQTRMVEEALARTRPLVKVATEIIRTRGDHEHVAPEVNEFDGVYLYDIDSLQEIASESHELRRQQMAAAEAIIDEHVADFQKHWGLSKSGTRSTKECPTRVSGELRASEL